MTEGPENFVGGLENIQGVSYYLDLFEKAPSEHAKTTVVNEKLVPWIQSKGTVSSQIANISRFVAQLSSLRYICFLDE